MLAVECILIYTGKELERKSLGLSLSLIFKCSFSQFVQFKVLCGEECSWAHLEGLEPRCAGAAGSCSQEQMVPFPGSDCGGLKSEVCVWGGGVYLHHKTHNVNYPPPSSSLLFTWTLLP